MSRTPNGCSPREALVLETLQRNGQVRLEIHGESMLPTLRPGDIAEIATASLAGAEAGEIVLAYREGRFYLHRLVQSRSSEFLARGDSMPTADPAYPRGAIRGKLVRVVRGDKVVVPSRSHLWARSAGLLFCYCAPARRAFLRLHGRRTVRFQVGESKAEQCLGEAQ